MATMLTIGEFSRMSFLSVKALHHYHDVGILEPADVDPQSGYRLYTADQVASAQVIRRLRDLGMPLDSIRAVMLAPDLEARNREIGAHLERMERQLEQTRATVTGLRALLGGPVPRPEISFRTIGPVAALAVTEVVTVAAAADWGTAAYAELFEALVLAGLTEAGPVGALFPSEFFELERGELTAFVPLALSPLQQGAFRQRTGQPGHGWPQGRVRLTEIAGTEAAVAVHDGPAGDIDRAYAALGTAVAERTIGVDGPIREYYPDGFDAQVPHRTEICWPVFRTGR
jgi:DNA-binding transcriptional MerR regulator